MHLSFTTTGSSHITRGLPCQDATDSIDLGGATLLVVADGAGSAEHSEEGSSAACRIALSQGVALWERSARAPELLGALAREIVTDSGPLFAAEAEQLARVRQCSVDEFSTTLAVAVVGWPWVAFAGVGDAFLVGGDPDGSLHLLVAPSKEGEFRNQTSFLSSTPQPQVRTICDGTLDGIVLSTDGLEKFIEERVVDAPDGSRVPVPWAPSRTFADLLREARSGTSAELLSTAFGTEEFQRRKGDDIGVSLAWR